MKNAFLIGEQIYLRVLDRSDAEGDYQQWLNDEETCEFLEHHVYPYPKSSAYAYIESLYDRKDIIMLAIVTKENDVHIGNITLNAISTLHKSAEFSLLIGNKECKGKGYAKEASLLMLKHGFYTMNLNRIWCGTMDTNMAMQNLALSLGMQKEGCKRQEVYKHGKYYDTFQYSILRDEFDTAPRRTNA